MNHRRAATLSKQGLDVFGAVEELHNLNAKEMNKLLRDSQHLFILRLRTGRGSYIRVNLEHLVSRLPLHLLACIASRGAESRLRYLLRGVRLLHSLSDLALRHPKLEQIFLQEVKIREQILDLIIYMLIALACPEQEGRHGSSFTILHTALVACCLHLLPAFVAGEWSDLVPVLLVHPKVDIFMDVAFDAVRRDIGLLHMKFRGLNSKLISNRVSPNVAESMAEVIAQQCEASIQVLQSLCQPQAFRDKVLNHKELCKNGGLLRLVLDVLKLQVPFYLAESNYLVSLVDRLKSKVLSLMVKFCETESVSFLDEVAADITAMHLAEMVAKEVLTLVKNALVEEPNDSQDSEEEENDGDDGVRSGLLYIHAMRLADIFSDDSNFRIYVMDFIASDLANVLAQSPTVFLSRWCIDSGSNEIKPGSDSVLIYDPFKAAGAAMQSFKSSGGSVRASGSNSALLPDESSGCSLSAGQVRFSSYSQERSALFVKILANLHCFNSEICPVDEKDRFLKSFVEYLAIGPFQPGNPYFFLSPVQTAVRICENLVMMLDHVASLSSEAVNDEDLQLASTFYRALHDVICPSATSESMQEDPVVSYVRDAHEQKRKSLLAQWQKSERWKRIHLFEPSDEKDQSNGGTSINRTTSNSFSSQPANGQHDASGLAEEAQSLGEQCMPKRKREDFESENDVAETGSRDHDDHHTFRGSVKGWNTEGGDTQMRFVEVSDERKADSRHNPCVDEQNISNREVLSGGIKEKPDVEMQSHELLHRIETVDPETNKPLFHEEVKIERVLPKVETEQECDLTCKSSMDINMAEAECTEYPSQKQLNSKEEKTNNSGCMELSVKGGERLFAPNPSTAVDCVLNMDAGDLGDTDCLEIRKSTARKTDGDLSFSLFQSSRDSANGDCIMKNEQKVNKTTVLEKKSNHSSNVNMHMERSENIDNSDRHEKCSELTVEIDAGEHKRNGDFSQGSAAKKLKGDIIRVKEISFELKLRAADPANCENPLIKLDCHGRANCIESSEDRRHDFVHIDDLSKVMHMQPNLEISRIGKESLPKDTYQQMQKAPVLCSSEPFQVSLPVVSQVYTTGESATNTSQSNISDASRGYRVLESNSHSFGGFNLPNRVQRTTSEEILPRKRKRNIMSEEQMAAMEKALKTEPYMRRHPELITQWTNTLNTIGPEISYQQLKNWLNNRKARLARQRVGEVSADIRMSMCSHDTSGPGSSTCSGSSNDLNRSTSEDGGNTRDSGSTLQTRHSSSISIQQCKLATEDIDAIMDIDVNAAARSNISPDVNRVTRVFLEPDPYSKHVISEVPELDLAAGTSQKSAPVKFVKCEAGQYVSLLDKDNKEAATGTLYQVEGIWQGKRIDEHGICIVKIEKLNVEKSTRLPHPSIAAGNTFEEAEKLCGQMVVAWDTKRIFLIS